MSAFLKFYSLKFQDSSLFATWNFYCELFLIEQKTLMLFSFYKLKNYMEFHEKIGKDMITIKMTKSSSYSTNMLAIIYNPTLNYPCHSI